jgi:glutamate transport system permease protein
VDALTDNFDAILEGFWLTIQLLVISGLIATVVGTFLAAMRVAPVRVMNAIGTSYVNVFRNTPLLVLFIIVVNGFPELGINLGFFTMAVIACSSYTAAFVCEAVRSGINAVDVGQAEAARAVGMTFNQTMGVIVLPQAFRAVVPPMASVFIALAKNTSIAAGFAVTDLTAALQRLANVNADQLLAVFAAVVLGYLAITLPSAWLIRLIENRVAIVR